MMNTEISFITFLSERKPKSLFIEQSDDDANKSDIQIKVDRVGM